MFPHKFNQMIKVAAFHQQWAFPYSIRPLRMFPSCLVHSPLKFGLGDAEYPTLTSTIVASASSAPSVGGSGAEYSGNFSSPSRC